MEAKKTKKADLDSRKGLFIQMGLITSLLVIIFIFEMTSSSASQLAFVDTREIIEEDVMPLPEQQPEPEQVAHVPVISDVFTIVDETANIENVFDWSIDPKNIPEPIYIYVPKPKGTEAAVEENIPFAAVEEKPKFQGGDQNTFSKWVNSRINYPESAQENGVQGKVMIQFTVDRDGYVKNASVIRKVDHDLDREALRVVSSSPRWTPGRQKTKDVAVVFQFPVVFQLQ